MNWWSSYSSSVDCSALLQHALQDTGTLVHAVEALTRLSGHPPWACCGLSTEAPSSDKTPIKQHLQDCAVQLLTGPSNSKSWIDHLQLAVPNQLLLAPSTLNQSVPTELEPVTELRTAVSQTAAEGSPDAIGTKIDSHGLPSTQDMGKGEAPALLSEMHRSAAAMSACVDNPDDNHRAAFAAATAAAVNDDTISMQSAQHPAAQRESEAAEQLVTQLLDNMGQLQDITLKAVHAATCPNPCVTTIKHASSAPNKAGLTHDTKLAGHSDLQDRKRHKSSQGLSRELKALQADAHHSSNNGTCQLDRYVTSNNATSILRQQQVTGQFSLRHTLARQKDSAPKPQQKSRFSHARSALLASAGLNADTNDIEALHRLLQSMKKGSGVHRRSIKDVNKDFRGIPAYRLQSGYH